MFASKMLSHYSRSAQDLKQEARLNQNESFIFDHSLTLFIQQQLFALQVNFHHATLPLLSFYE
jgi:hypothetical protein